MIGGCPYTDTDPHGQIARIFAIARRFDLDIDFHLDFDLDPSWMHLDEVCRQTEPTAGAAGSPSATSPSSRRCRPARLSRSPAGWPTPGVAVTVLPATDLFLMGRGARPHVPRGVAPAHRLLKHGVTCSLATNNVLNPFTPFGDCSLIRMANLYANIAQLGRARRHARLLRHGHRAAGAADESAGLRHRGRPSRPTSWSSTAAIRRWRWPSSRNRCSATSAADAVSPTPRQPCIVQERMGQNSHR